ncbi:MAG: glycoside hydrolase family 57 protein [Bacillota bacterium]
MHKGYLCMILHAHLPYVRHPEHENFLEERWLYEAITETYIPLINVFERLTDENIPFRLTMSLTPTLISMLTDGLLQERYLKHLEKLIELSDKEAGRTYNTAFHESALMYQSIFRRSRETFYRYDKNLVNAFKKFQDLGRLEIMTCGATHGFLPLMLLNRNAVSAQVKTAIDLHVKHLGRYPQGIWLPECAYTPGIDAVLKENGIKYFILDTHGIIFASHRPRYGVYAPVFCPTGVAAFGRDTESSKQVWSANEGYPGDPYYREFYRDIGYDMDFEYIKPYIHPDGIRIHTGMKYYRITGKSSHKEPYIPSVAVEKAATHAGNFMFNRELQVEYLSGLMDRPPVIVAPYDAELFGHWWFEGPIWLEFLIKKIHYDQNKFTMITPGDYLKLHGYNQVATPCASTWGHKGYNEVWLCGQNDWIYRHLHAVSDKMVELAESFHNAGGLQSRALNQAARELILAQSSDWAFIMSTGTMTEYAIRRTKTHIDNFLRLYREIKEHRIDEGFLHYLESKNNIFPDIDYRSYAAKKSA